MKAKVFFLLVAIVMSATTIKAAVASGTCGTNLTWTVNTKDSTLIINGYGPMDASVPFNFEQYHSYIKYLYLPEGMTTIGYEAFKYFNNLVRVNIPKSITKSGNGAFKNCDKLDSVFITDIAAWCSIDFYWDKYYNGATSNPLVKAKHLYLNGEKVTDLIIPDSVKYIGNYSFSDCSDLKTLVIQEGDSIVGTHAFMNCKSLTSVTFPTTVKYVRTGAFSGCEDIKHVHITDLAAWSQIHFAYNNKYDSISNPLYYAKHLYLDGEKITNLEIPEGVDRIGGCAFFGCVDFTSISIPSSAVFVGERVFRHCPNISTLVVNATTPPENAKYCGINPANCTLYVPEESIEVYSNTLWWEDFYQILPIENSITSLETINRMQDTEKTKLLYNGCLYINSHDETFTIQGQRVR